MNLISYSQQCKYDIGIIKKLELSPSRPLNVLSWVSYNFLIFLPYGDNTIGQSHFEIRNNIGFPGGSDNKESSYNTGNPGSNPGSGISPEKRNVYPLQYSFLENPINKGDWQATVHGVTKSWT